jgi:NADH dehydrogenase
VTSVDATHVRIGEDKVVPASVVIWAAGVAASPMGKLLGVPTDRAGRVKVEPDLSIPGHPEVFVLGDLASVMQPNGHPIPGVAPAAIQMGEFAADAIEADRKGQPRGVFHYHDKGSMATIGRSSAVAQFHGLKLSGMPAWLAWLFVHLMFLIGFRSRAQVLWEWFWAYLHFQRGARLITGISRSIVPPVVPNAATGAPPPEAPK